MTKVKKNQRTPERAKWVRGQAAVRELLERLVRDDNRVRVDLRLADPGDPAWVYIGPGDRPIFADDDHQAVDPIVLGAAATGRVLEVKYDTGTQEDDGPRIRFRHEANNDVQFVVLSPALVRSLRVRPEPVKHDVTENSALVTHDDGSVTVTSYGCGSGREAQWSRRDAVRALRLLAAHLGYEVSPPCPRRPAKP